MEINSEQLQQLSRDELIDIIQTQADLLAAQAAQIAQLQLQVQALTDQLNKNSRNSSKPPSSDGFKKQPKSQRKKGHKRNGGQPGHVGETLEMVAEPDVIEAHALDQCPACDADLQGVSSHDMQKRQVFDVPPVRMVVTEHQAEVKCCPQCQREVRASFPENVTQPVQYGPGLQAQVVYLNTYQLLPIARIAEYVGDVYGHTPSEGLIVEALKRAQGHIIPAVDAIFAAVTQADVVHYDETGLRVNGKGHWLHTASTDTLSYYLVHEKRGEDAMLDMNVLPLQRGVAVHDGFKTYFGFEAVEHALCNAHHLRELTLFADKDEAWAQGLIEVLLAMKTATEQARANDSPIPQADITAYEVRYDELIVQGLKAHPVQAKPDGHKGRMKQSDATNLLLRLQKYRAETLRFLHDLRVPFDNNQAERDIRMMKVKQKISGGFRTADGADRFAMIRSYIDTARKQGARVLNALRDAFLGQPVMPAPNTPE
jgi:transposase